MSRPVAIKIAELKLNFTEMDSRVIELISMTSARLKQLEAVCLERAPYIFFLEPREKQVCIKGRFSHILRGSSTLSR